MTVWKYIDTSIDFVQIEVLIQFHFSKHLDKQMSLEDAV